MSGIATDRARITATVASCDPSSRNESICILTLSTTCTCRKTHFSPISYSASYSHDLDVSDLPSKLSALKSCHNSKKTQSVNKVIARHRFSYANLIILKMLGYGPKRFNSCMFDIRIWIWAQRHQRWNNLLRSRFQLYISNLWNTYIRSMSLWYITEHHAWQQKSNTDDTISE